MLILLSCMKLDKNESTSNNFDAKVFWDLIELLNQKFII